MVCKNSKIRQKKAVRKAVFYVVKLGNSTDLVKTLPRDINVFMNADWILLSTLRKQEEFNKGLKFNIVRSLKPSPYTAYVLFESLYEIGTYR